MTKLLYWLHPNATTWNDAYVVSTGRDENGIWMELNETIGHVRGGGQLGDRGQINDLQLIDVRKCRKTGAVRHYVDRIDGVREGSDAEISIDAEFRHRNSVWHSSGHLLGRVVESLYSGIVATNGHHYPCEARVEFTYSATDAVELDTINHALEAALLTPVETITSFGDGSERFVEIGGYSKIGCGGTHVSSTSAIKTIIVSKVASKNGVLRISYSAS